MLNHCLSFYDPETDLDPRVNQSETISNSTFNSKSSNPSTQTESSIPTWIQRHAVAERSYPYSYNSNDITIETSKEPKPLNLPFVDLNESVNSDEAYLFFDCAEIPEGTNSVCENSQS